MTKKKCIICETVKDASLFNEEHIIPESLGNSKLKIYDVCTICNSKLGSKVDCAITNNFISEIYRQFHRIAGKSGSIPNPFQKGRTKDGRTIQVDDNMKPHFVPEVSFNEETGRLSVAVESYEAGVSIINKKLLRLGLPKLTDEQISELKDKTATKYEQPEIGYEFITDLYKVSLAFMKIAYEFGYKYCGESYLQDSLAQEIRGILYDHIYKDSRDIDLWKYTQPMPLDAKQDIMSKIKMLKHETTSDKIHMLVTATSPDGIILNVFIDDLYAYGIRFLSTNNNVLKRNKMVVVLYPSGEILDV